MHLDDDDDIFDEDDFEDLEDEDDDDEDLDDEIMPSDDDDDVFDVLEYNDTSQIQTRSEIIADIRMYLRQYQPMYKLVRRKSDR